MERRGHPPNLDSLVLVADGQQVQQDLVEIAQGEVYAHHRRCIARPHVGAEERKDIRDRKRKRSHVIW